jgi:hypothetical protein
MAGLFSSPKVQAPIIPAPVVVPTENTAGVTAAKQQEMMAASQQSGRASTILSQNDISKTDTMGG